MYTGSTNMNSHHEALRIAAQQLSAIAGLLAAYPRMSNDPNGRMLLDARELATDAARAAQIAADQP
jgi:hypothetical protein